jgi:hypothetical protein
MIELFLDPLIITLTAFLFQAAVWFLWMPEEPTIRGAMGRFTSGEAQFRYLIFLSVWVLAILWGRFQALSATQKLNATQKQKERSFRPSTVRYLDRIALVALVLSIFGELVYARDLIFDPSILIRAIQSGWLASVGTEASNEGIKGLSTLVNLFSVPTAIYALFTFHPQIDPKFRRQRRRRLIGIGIWMLAHGMILAARTFFVNYCFIVAAAYLMTRRRQIRHPWRWIGLVGVAALSTVWLGETLRAGYYYSFLTGNALFSAKTQQYVFSYLVQAYFGADFNNAQVLLDCAPSMTWITTAIFFRSIATLLFHPQFYGYESFCTDFSSIYATVNIFGLWWFDMGWFGLVVALVAGAWLGYIYTVTMRQLPEIGIITVLYLIVYPGLISLIRLNFFGLAFFTLPAGFLFTAWLVAPKRSRARGRARSPEAVSLS